MHATAKLTSKGQITIPLSVRKRLGLRAGDNLVFAESGRIISVTREDSEESPFDKYQGIGNPGIGSGSEAISRYMSELRGYDDFDR